MKNIGIMILVVSLIAFLVAGFLSTPSKDEARVLRLLKNDSYWQERADEYAEKRMKNPKIYIALGVGAFSFIGGCIFFAAGRLEESKSK